MNEDYQRFLQTPVILPCTRCERSLTLARLISKWKEHMPELDGWVWINNKLCCPQCVAEHDAAKGRRGDTEREAPAPRPGVSVSPRHSTPLLVPGHQELNYTAAMEQSTCLRCGEIIEWEPDRKAIPPTCWAWCCGYEYVLVGKTALVTVRDVPISDDEEEED